MSAPSFQAKGQKKSDSAPAKWSPGTKLWDTMLYHKKTGTVEKYPGPTTVDAEGNNDSCYLLFKHPEHLLSVAAFADNELTNSATEMINGKRMSVGMSELAAVLSNMDFIIVDGGAREIFHPKLVSTWKALKETHDLTNLCRQLNSGEFPQEVRTEQTMTTAVENLLNLSTVIRRDWSHWTEVYCRGAGLFVDVS
jgi:hypothetical protein